MNQAVILVGGKGTRLGALTAATPKPMLNISGRPFIYILMKELARHGFQDIVLLCGHLAEQIYAVFEGMTVRGAQVRCVVEPQSMGTAGALQQAADLLDDEFLLLNGDSLFDFNLLDLQTIKTNESWIGKVALRPLSDTGRYGTVTLDGELIISFAEKTASGCGLINGGVYMLRREVLGYIQSIPCSLENDIIPRLVAEGKLFGRAYSGYFIDIGIPEDLCRAQVELSGRLRPAIFLDRDGVLNYDDGYTHRIENFRWIPGAMETIRFFNDQGWLVFVVTNQAGIARGFYDEATVLALHEWMQTQLRQQGAHIDAFYFCPHHPEGMVKELAIECNCRKPAPGMLLKAMKEWPEIDINSSWLIGDKLSDLEAAARSGVRGRLFEDWNLLSIAHDILGLHDTEKTLTEVL